MFTNYLATQVLMYLFCEKNTNNKYMKRCFITLLISDINQDVTTITTWFSKVPQNGTLWPI